LACIFLKIIMKTMTEVHPFGIFQLFFGLSSFNYEVNSESLLNSDSVDFFNEE
jgi:hypothetical protein